MSKNGLSQTGKGDWLGLHGLEEEACVRVSAHRLGPMWFEFPTNTKGGSGCTILLAFLDTGQEGKGEMRESYQQSNFRNCIKLLITTYLDV